MKKVLITGYYGFSNSGDEAVLLEIIERLRESIPGVEITVLSNAPQETAATYGVQAVDRWQYSKLFAALRRCDLFILGGGSLLQDITGPRSIFFYLGQIYLARLLGRRVFLYAQGIGPIQDPQNQKRVAACLKKCACITLRDPQSAALLADLGVPEEKIFVTVDPVLASHERELPPAMPSGKKIGFALRPWEGLDKQALADFADELGRIGYQIVFLPFQEPNDRSLAEEIIQKMKTPGYLPQQIAPTEMYAAISGMEIVIGMRLHSLIIAAAAGVPFAAISYDPKVDAFCRFIGLAAATSCENFSRTDLERMVIELLKRRPVLSAFFQSQKEKWAELAQANAIMAREYAFGEKGYTLEHALAEVAKTKAAEAANKQANHPQKME